MTNSELAQKIKMSMSGHRYKHTIGVAESAVKLAAMYGADQDKAEKAALLHDIARDRTADELLHLARKYGIEPDEVERAVPDLLHGKIGAAIACDLFGITDPQILDSVTYHTTGRRGMNLLEKIIFIADMIEPGRNFPSVERLRELAFKELNAAVVAGIESTVRFVLDRGLAIHPASIEARNDLLGLLGKKQELI